MNVARANSYQSLNSEVSEDLKSFSHQPIIRRPGDNLRHHGDNMRHHGDKIRQFGSGGIRGENNHHYSDSTEEISNREIPPPREIPVSEAEFHSRFMSRGSPSVYETTNFHAPQRSFSSDRSGGADLPGNDIHGNGDPGSGGSGTLRRRYQPASHGQMGAVRKVNSGNREEPRRWDHGGRGGVENIDYINPRYGEIRTPHPPEQNMRGE